MTETLDKHQVNHVTSAMPLQVVCLEHTGKEQTQEWVYIRPLCTPHCATPLSVEKTMQPLTPAQIHRKSLTMIPQAIREWDKSGSGLFSDFILAYIQLKWRSIIEAYGGGGSLRMGKTHL